jgi:hypothetical protein
MFHCTFSNSWPTLATLADNGARTKQGAKNKRRQKTPVAQGRRDLLVYQSVSIYYTHIPANMECIIYNA